MEKVIIFSAPSGSGKSTIVNHLLTQFKELKFSVSLTTRKPRVGEIEGVDYYFTTPDIFLEKVKTGELLEYEEVYESQYYGTLKSEVEKIWESGGIVVFDVDVVGGVRLKECFKEKALSVFVKPPSLEVLRERLVGRGTESQESIEKRVNKASKEMQYIVDFDVVVVNDNLQTTLKEAIKVVSAFIRSN